MAESNKDSACDFPLNIGSFHKNMKYEQVCSKRYNEARQGYNDQFLKELAVQEGMERNGLNASKVHRNFCDPVLKPSDKMKMVKLNPQEKRKIEELMKDNTIWG